MRDVQDGHAAVDKLPHPLEQPPDRVALKRRGRLVKQHALGAAGERPRDFDDLPLLYGEIPARRPGLDVVAPVAHHLAGPGAHHPPAQEPVGAAKEHVLGHGKAGDDHRVLEDGRDPLAPPGNVADPRRWLRRRT